MATPFLDLVAEIRKLGDAPKVTYPHDDTAYPVTERVLKIKRSATGAEGPDPTYGQAEPDGTRFPNLVLVEQLEVGRDMQWVEVYRKYERLPGKATSTTRTDDDGATVTVTTQRMLTSDIATSDSVDGPGTTWTKKWKGEGTGYAGTQMSEVRSLPGSEYTTEKKTDDNGNTMTTTVKLVKAADASLAVNAAGSEKRYEATSKAVGRIITVTYPESFAEISEERSADDRVPGSRETVTYQIFPRTTALPADTSTIVYRKLKHPTNELLYIREKTEYAVPADFVEIEDQSQPFPEIFQGAIGDETFGVYWLYRAGFSEIRPTRIEHHFSTTLPDLAADMTPTIIREGAWRYPLGFSGKALTDEDEITLLKGGATLVLNLPASTPSAAAYLAMIAGEDELFVGGFAKVWRAKIYHILKLYTLAQ